VPCPVESNSEDGPVRFAIASRGPWPVPNGRRADACALCETQVRPQMVAARRRAPGTVTIGGVEDDATGARPGQDTRAC